MILPIIVDRLRPYLANKVQISLSLLVNFILFYPYIIAFVFCILILNPDRDINYS